MKAAVFHGPGDIRLDDVVAGGFDELVAHKDRHVKILVRSPEG